MFYRISSINPDVLSLNIKIHFHYMSDQGNVICNISVSMDRMFYCTCSNTEVYCILRCVIIHQCVDDSAYKCISPSHSVQNVESQTSAFIDFSIFPQISRKTVLTASVCKSHMSRNAFDIWISLHKGFKYFFLFFTVGLERNTVLHISGSMILFIFPDMIRFYSKKNIHIWQTECTEISGFFPAP